MKTNTVQKIEEFKISSLIPILSPVVILLLFYSLRWSAVLGAVLFTAMVCLSPAIFRTRGGSLVPAICLAAFVWLSAAVVFVLSFFGAH
jgi:Na+/H+-translocating membrane pyrophosphatase